MSGKPNNLAIYPVISVIIPVYNAEKLLKRCLDSVFSQQGDFDQEVITIDDGSTDCSVEVLRSYSESIKIITQSNEGAASARNKGIKVATGKYLAFLDADDYWLSGFLAKTSEALENNQLIAVNCGQIHKISSKKEIITPSFISDKRQSNPKLIFINRFYEFWGKHKHICTGSVLIKTYVVKETKGQLKELRISQDLEFWSYLGSYGKWGFLPEILFVSDGGKVTKERGWLNKNMVRWKATPSIETFTRRTLSMISEDDLADYEIIIGWVAYNFTYGHIMAKDFTKAFNNISAYGNKFPYSKGSKLFKFCHSFGRIGFTVLTTFFRLFQISRQYMLSKLNQTKQI